MPAKFESVLRPVTYCTPSIVTYPSSTSPEIVSILLSIYVLTANDVGKLALVSKLVTISLVAAGAKVPTCVVVKLDEPVHVDNLIFSTFPNPISVLFKLTSALNA